MLPDARGYEDLSLGLVRAQRGMDEFKVEGLGMLRGYFTVRAQDV